MGSPLSDPPTMDIDSLIDRWDDAGGLAPGTDEMLRFGSDAPVSWMAGAPEGGLAFGTRAGPSAPKRDCLLWLQKDDQGRIEEVKQLLIETGGRIRRPYMDSHWYSEEQYLRNRRATKVVLRSLVVVVDFSESMKALDFKPNRIVCVQGFLQEFVDEFFRTSPVSQMAVIAMAHKDAFVLSPLTGSRAQLAEAIDASGAAAGGNTYDLTGSDPSLQAALERALRILQTGPAYASRQILVVYGSSWTNDAGDLEETLKTLKAQGVMVMCASIAPELRILKRICSETGGTYQVAMNRQMLREALMKNSVPQPQQTTFRSQTELNLIKMGFPTVISQTTLSLCVCHNQLGFDRYPCPECQVRSCSIPTTCKGCDLPLISSADIVRCQLVDMVPPPFVPLPEGKGSCFLCCRNFTSGGGQCPACRGFVCFNCDVLVHQSIKFCPNCHKEQVLQQQSSIKPEEVSLIMPGEGTSDRKFLEKVIAIEETKRQCPIQIGQ